MTRQRVLQLYIGGIGFTAAAFFAICIAAILRMPPHLALSWAPAAALFLVLGIAGSHRQVVIGESTSHQMGTVAYIAALLLLPYAVAAATIGTSKGLSELWLWRRKERRLRAVVVNTGATLLSNAAGGAAFYLLRGEHYVWQHDLHALETLPALAALAILYVAIEWSIVVGAVTLSSREAPWGIFHTLLKDTFLGEISLIFVGVVFAVFCHFSPVLSLFVIVPVMFSLRAFEAVVRLRQETIDAVLKMAESIDYRDTGTAEHSKRIEELTRGLAKAVGLIPEEVNEIALASRVHDLGKIGMSNEILFKRGPLSPDERMSMQDHPDIGAEILSSFSQFKGSVEIVKHHHERWDGSGYPDKLKGDEIPIGSRIISVVDAFDSMTSNRPYRNGMSVDAAVDRLKQGIGSQFDPKVCATFIQMLIEEGTYVPADVSPDLRLVSVELGTAS